MLKCNNCEKPAMFTVGDHQVPLCLDCYTKLQQTISQQQADNERWLNYLSDEMDAIVGIGPIGPRFPPRPQPAIVRGGTFNNIRVSDSTIGVINTGQLQQVDTAITVIGQHGDKRLAEAIKSLADLIVADPSMDAKDKEDAIAILSALSSEATVTPDQRRTGVAKPLLGRLREILSDAANIATVGQALLPIIAAAFGLK